MMKNAQLLSWVQLFATPSSIAHQAPLSMGFPGQEYRSEVPLPPPGESSRPRDRNPIPYVSCIGRWILYYCATWEVQAPWGNGQYRGQGPQYFQEPTKIDYIS